ncbi:MAG: peptide deformylase [Candidatus Nomurabacteria bacterium]|jgi:peptide deformylase|nr:peptide deformylase [Candidatus Nomurabacteria bacterium]
MKSKYTKKDILTLPNPRLREKSERVHVITDETLQLVDDMITATLDWEDSRPHELAVALSAVQIGALERVVIIREDFEDRDNKNFVVLINPEIVKFEGKKITEIEGCLSVRDVYGKVARYEKVRVKAVGIDGREIRIKSPNPFVARMLQHEVDHCNGKCFVDHITHNKTAFLLLNRDGDLEDVKYEKVARMGILKDD